MVTAGLTVVAIIFGCDGSGAGRQRGAAVLDRRDGRGTQPVVVVAEVEDEDLLRDVHVLVVLVADVALDRLDVTPATAPRLDVVAAPRAHGRLARAETVAHVALEDDAVALGETEGLVRALQRRALRNEAREDGRIHRAPAVRNRSETWSVFGTSTSGFALNDANRTRMVVFQNQVQRYFVLI